MGIHTALLKLKRIGIVEYWLTVAILFGVIVYRIGWPTSLFALSAILVIYFQPDIKSRLLHFLGNISYSLYLSHTLIAFFFINLGIRFTTHGYQKIFFVTLAVAATLFFSYLLYRFVEKPAKKWAAVINYRHE
jgi:peptidoglycan/LPS O-acetylase OafA/YrhL